MYLVLEKNTFPFSPIAILEGRQYKINTHITYPLRRLRLICDTEHRYAEGLIP